MIYKKNISTRVCKKIFLIRANNFKKNCTGCNKSAVTGCKQNFSRKKKFIGVFPTKSWKKSRNFRYGSSEDLLSKGIGGLIPTPPPPGPYMVKIDTDTQGLDPDPVLYGPEQ